MMRMRAEKKISRAIILGKLLYPSPQSRPPSCKDSHELVETPLPLSYCLPCKLPTQLLPCSKDQNHPNYLWTGLQCVSLLSRPMLSFKIFQQLYTRLKQNKTCHQKINTNCIVKSFYFYNLMPAPPRPPNPGLRTVTQFLYTDTFLPPLIAFTSFQMETPNANPACAKPHKTNRYAAPLPPPRSSISLTQLPGRGRPI